MVWFKAVRHEIWTQSIRFRPLYLWFAFYNFKNYLNMSNMFNSKYSFHKPDLTMIEASTLSLHKEESFKFSMLLKPSRYLLSHAVGIISCRYQSPLRCHSCSGEKTEFNTYCTWKHLKNFRNRSSYLLCSKWSHHWC